MPVTFDVIWYHPILLTVHTIFVTEREANIYKKNNQRYHNLQKMTPNNIKRLEGFEYEMLGMRKKTRNPMT